MLQGSLKVFDILCMIPFCDQLTTYNLIMIRSALHYSMPDLQKEYFNVMSNFFSYMFRMFFVFDLVFISISYVFRIFFVLSLWSFSCFQCILVVFSWKTLSTHLIRISYFEGNISSAQLWPCGSAHRTIEGIAHGMLGYFLAIQV